MSSDGSDLRQRYAEALAATNMLDKTDLEFTLHLVLGIHEEETAKLREERDLAIAHDRQPYPTAWAYEQACKALNDWRERAEKARVEADELRELVKELTDSGPCQYDHEDQCQGHSLHYRPCPHGRAQALFKEQEGE